MINVTGNSQGFIDFAFRNFDNPADKKTWVRVTEKNYIVNIASGISDAYLSELERWCTIMGAKAEFNENKNGGRFEFHNFVVVEKDKLYDILRNNYKDALVWAKTNGRAVTREEYATIQEKAKLEYDRGCAYIDDTVGRATYIKEDAAPAYYLHYNLASVCPEKKYQALIAR